MTEPLLSVVIPTYQRPALLVACLQSLAQQDYPRERFEVIVVDDGGCLDETSLNAQFAAQFDLTLIRDTHGGPGTARNTGARHARGTWLYFVDDDCQLMPDMLTMLATRFERHPNAAIAGACADAHPRNVWSAASQAQLDAVVSYYNRGPDHATSCAGSHWAVPAALFRTLGGYDVRFLNSEDRDVVDRWLTSGHTLVYAPELVVTHLHPHTFRQLWQRNVHYGRGAWQYAEVRRSQQHGAPRFDPGFYAHLLSYPFRVRHAFRVRLLAGLILARMAYSYGYFAARFKASRRQQPDGGRSC